MSEFWLVTSRRYEHHESLDESVAFMQRLQKHRPNLKLRIYRCKQNTRSAHHFPKMVELLEDIQREGLTREISNRIHILLSTIRTRSGDVTKRSKPAGQL